MFVEIYQITDVSLVKQAKMSELDAYNSSPMNTNIF